jgi:hypothetical protein
MVAVELLGVLLVVAIVDPFEVNLIKVAPSYSLADLVSVSPNLPHPLHFTSPCLSSRRDPWRSILSWSSISSIDHLVTVVDLGFSLLLDFSLFVPVPLLPPGEVLLQSLNASVFLGRSPPSPFAFMAELIYPPASMAELIRPCSELSKVVPMSITPLLNALVYSWSDLPRFASPLLLLWFWVVPMSSSLWHPPLRRTLLPVPATALSS